MDCLIRLSNQILFVFESDDAANRPENLFLSHAHLVLHFAEDGRLEEIAFLEFFVEHGRLAAYKHCRAFCARNSDVRFDSFQLLRRNLRPHLRRFVRGVAHLHLLRFLLELFQKLVLHSFIQKKTRASAAYLPLIEEDAHHRAVYGLLNVRVREHYVRRFAAEFKRDFCKIVCGGFRNQLADFGRACESYLVNIWMRSERSARRFSESGHYVDDAIRETRLLNQSRKFHCPDGRLLGRFEHDRVACGERGRKLPRCHQERKVPRDYLPAHANGFAQGIVEELTRNRNRLAFNLRSETREVFKILHDLRQINVERFAYGLSVVCCLKLGKLFSILFYQLSELEKKATAFARAHASPLSLERAASCRDGLFNIGLICFRDFSERFARRRVRRSKSLARFGVNKFPINEKLVLARLARRCLLN